MFIFERERGRERKRGREREKGREGGRGRERGRQRIRSRIFPDSAEPCARLELMNCEISHPGTPKIF